MSITKQDYREWHQATLDRLYSHLEPFKEVRKDGTIKIHDCYNDLAVDRENWLNKITDKQWVV